MKQTIKKLFIALSIFSLMAQGAVAQEIQLTKGDPYSLYEINLRGGHFISFQQEEGAAVFDYCESTKGRLICENFAVVPKEDAQQVLAEVHYLWQKDLTTETLRIENKNKLLFNKNKLGASLIQVIHLFGLAVGAILAVFLLATAAGGSLTAGTIAILLAGSTAFGTFSTFNYLQFSQNNELIRSSLRINNKIDNIYESFQKIDIDLNQPIFMKITKEEAGEFKKYLNEVTGNRLNKISK